MYGAGGIDVDQEDMNRFFGMNLKAKPFFFPDNAFLIGPDQLQGYVKLLFGIRQVDQRLDSQMPSNAIQHPLGLKRCKTAERVTIRQSQDDITLFFDKYEIGIFLHDPDPFYL